MLRINLEKETQKLIKFIRAVLKQQGFQKVILALSGGVDSSTVLALAVRALGKNNVLAAILPFGKLNKEETKAALLTAKLFKIPKKNIFLMDIEPIVDSFLKLSFRSSKIRKGNIIARVRMILLYDLAKKNKALVCGTENRSEYLLGYYTRFGDEAADLEPLRNVYKTNVKQMAKNLGIPQKIINRPPSAGLWQGQTDEKELGFSYQEADPILYLHFNKNYSWKKIVQLGFKKRLVEKVKKRVQENEFKKKVPYLAEV